MKNIIFLAAAFCMGMSSFSWSMDSEPHKDLTTQEHGTTQAQHRAMSVMYGGIQSSREPLPFAHSSLPMRGMVGGPPAPKATAQDHACSFRSPPLPMFGIEGVGTGMGGGPPSPSTISNVKKKDKPRIIPVQRPIMEQMFMEMMGCKEQIDKLKQRILAAGDLKGHPDLKHFLTTYNTNNKTQRLEYFYESMHPLLERIKSELLHKNHLIASGVCDREFAEAYRNVENKIHAASTFIDIYDRFDATLKELRGAFEKAGCVWTLTLPEPAPSEPFQPAVFDPTDALDALTRLEEQQKRIEDEEKARVQLYKATVVVKKEDAAARATDGVSSTKEDSLNDSA